jgi:hypothetical protein
LQSPSGSVTSPQPFRDWMDWLAAGIVTNSKQGKTMASKTRFMVLSPFLVASALSAGLDRLQPGGVGDPLVSNHEFGWQFTR